MSKRRPNQPGALRLYGGIPSPLGVNRRDIADAVRRFHTVRESVAAPERHTVRTAVREATVGEARITQPGRLRIRLIRAGWSLNGNHYPAEVLRRDGPTAWPKGTLCYADHASDDEEQQHPSGSVKNLAAVLTSDAQWDETEQALFAEARLFAPWREAITDMADAIGMSIRAWVNGENGEINGREGFLVSAIPQGRSVDFVTVPAAGGGIVSVLEAVGNQARPVGEARTLGAWLESRLHLTLTTYADDMYGDGRLTRDERIVLSTAIGEGLQAWTAHVEANAPQLFNRDLWEYPEPPATPAEESRRATEASTEETRTALQQALKAIHSGDDTWVWVRDFDPDRALAWFEVSTDGESKLWEQAFTPGDNRPELTGDPVEVVARIVYAPVAGTHEATTPAPPLTASPVTENVTDGAPPTALNNPPSQEEPVSGTQTGAPPEQAGTATVPDNGQPPTTSTVTAESMASTLQALLAEAMKPLTEQLAAVTARDAAREAENRTLRNRQVAAEAVTTALRAPEHADVAASIAGRVNTRVTANVPTTSEGVVDDTLLAEVITAAIADEATHVRRERANALAEAGVGLPYGVGAAPAQEATDDGGLNDELTNFFAGTLGMTSEQAKIAAKGRG